MSEAGTWHTTRTLALARSTNSRCTFVRWHCAVGLSVCLLLQKRMNRSRRHFGSGHEGAQETMRLGCSHATAHIREGHTRTCPAVDILKVTHKRAAGCNVACSYQLLWQLFVYWAKTDHAFSFHRPWPCTRPHQLGGELSHWIWGNLVRHLVSSLDWWSVPGTFLDSYASATLGKLVASSAKGRPGRDCCSVRRPGCNADASTEKHSAHSMWITTYGGAGRWCLGPRDQVQQQAEQWLAPGRNAWSARRRCSWTRSIVRATLSHLRQQPRRRRYDPRIYCAPITRWTGKQTTLDWGPKSNQQPHYYYC